MQQKNMTARISAFARAYHAENASAHVFFDPLARRLLGGDYDAAAESMASGVGFFCPGFHGTPSEALAVIVEQYLAPSLLGRAAFAEAALENAVRIGTEQYLVFAAGRL